MHLVSFADVEAARERISAAPAEVGVLHTPLLPMPGGSASAAHPVWIKPECLQPTGAFKLRGAVHALSRLQPAVRDRGVVAYSSGNHARAVAYAARVFGVPAAVCVPHTTPAAKVDAARELGAEIVSVDPAEREVRAKELCTQRGATLVPPFDHPDVITGQGTVGAEIVADLPDVDVVLVPVSGGGLISGVATAVRALRPSARVIGVEPEMAADAQHSFRDGALRSWPIEQRTRTTADGLTAQPSELTFAHLRERVDDILAVPEEAIADAVGHIARSCRVVAEFSGAVTVAAYRHHGDRLPPGRTVAIVSGGNIDPTALAGALTASKPTWAG